MCDHLAWDGDSRISIVVCSSTVNKKHGPSVRTKAFFIFSSSLREVYFHMDFYDCVMNIVVKFYSVP